LLPGYAERTLEHLTESSMATNVIPRQQSWTEKFRSRPAEDTTNEVANNLGELPVDLTSARYFLDIEIDGVKVGRLLIELFWTIVPKTARNFAMLCTGQCGNSETTGRPLHYKGCKFYRVQPERLVQAGDINEDGRGESIYGRTFPDENFDLCHNSAGLLSMSNNGPNTNSSLFMIMLDQVTNHKEAIKTV
jgi:cyclophilin family peptidyl-prolyl cis-trans isomerase